MNNTQINSELELLCLKNKLQTEKKMMDLFIMIGYLFQVII